MSSLGTIWCKTTQNVPSHCPLRTIPSSFHESVPFGTSPILVWNRVWFLKELLDCMNVFIIQFQMSKRERKICEFEMDLKNFFVCALI